MKLLDTIVAAQVEALVADCTPILLPNRVATSVTRDIVARNKSLRVAVAGWTY